jgi:deoxyribose-phosphate aldolase
LNLSAIKKRAAEFATRRTVKKDHQAAWLLRAVTCIDLTTLSGDDTNSNVQKLCLKAANPIRFDLLKAVGLPGMPNIIK